MDMSSAEYQRIGYKKNRAKHLEYVQSYRETHPWIAIYSNIKARCEKPSTRSYKNYGAKGIKCRITSEEIKTLWYRDKADTMKKPSIDRKDNKKDYCFENCQFLELAENSRKRG